jgi:hypothetical protein
MTTGKVFSAKVGWNDSRSGSGAACENIYSPLNPVVRYSNPWDLQ